MLALAGLAKPLPVMVTLAPGAALLGLMPVMTTLTGAGLPTVKSSWPGANGDALAVSATELRAGGLDVDVDTGQARGDRGLGGDLQGAGAAAGQIDDDGIDRRIGRGDADHRTLTNHQVVLPVDSASGLGALTVTVARPTTGSGLGLPQVGNTVCSALTAVSPCWTPVRRPSGETVAMAVDAVLQAVPAPLVMSWVVPSE